jgi:hypothetical protein
LQPFTGNGDISMCEKFSSGTLNIKIINQLTNSDGPPAVTRDLNFPVSSEELGTTFNLCTELDTHKRVFELLDQASFPS